MLYVVFFLFAGALVSYYIHPMLAIDATIV